MKLTTSALLLSRGILCLSTEREFEGLVLFCTYPIPQTQSPRLLKKNPKTGYVRYFVCASNGTLNLKTQIIPMPNLEGLSLFSPVSSPQDSLDINLNFEDTALDPALHNYPGGRDDLSPSHNLVLF